MRNGAGYSNTGEDRVIASLLSAVDGPRFCVDIGAGDGRLMSNTLALYEQGWEGLLVEMDGAAFQALASLHARSPGISLFRCRVTPDNVLGILDAAGVPGDFGVLSLDIDGYDFFVLDSILTRYRPSLVCTEINEKIPPPLRFTVSYDPDYAWQANHFYGQSISQLAVLCERHAYAIVELEYNNALLMPAERAPTGLSPEEAYRRGYADRPDRRTRFPWNDDLEHLHHLSPTEAAAALDEVFAPYRGKYLLEIGEP